jgi:hypothetical protein
MLVKAKFNPLFKAVGKIVMKTVNEPAKGAEEVADKASGEQKAGSGEEIGEENTGNEKNNRDSK